MSRSGYSEGCDGSQEENWAMIRYRGAVKSALRGKRGQAFLKELVAALDALPEAELISGELESSHGVCAIGAVGKARGFDLAAINPNDPEAVSKAFNIADCMAREIAFINDEGLASSPHGRFREVRDWAVENLKKKGGKA